MAGESQRLGANFTIDITNIKTGLLQANRLIKESESEFKASAAAIGDWQNNADGLRAKITSLNTVIDLQKKKVAAMEEDYKKLVAGGLDEASRAAVEYRTKINSEKAALEKNKKELEKQEAALDDVENGSKKAGKEMDGLGKSAKSSGDGFSIAGGAIATFAGNILTSLISKVGEAVSALFGLAEATREFREDTTRLESAFKGAGFSAESAESAYTKLYRAIGETDTAVEASQQIALLADSEEEVAKWADLATGVVATFGDALKPETFFEAANETLKLGEATGAFTQMLEGTGVDVEKFNKGLEACTTEAEKQAYMLAVSEKALGSAGKAYEEAAGDILDAREASLKLEQAQADLGAAMEPLNTKITDLKTALLTEFSPAITQIADDLMGVLEGAEGAPERLANTVSSAIGDLVAQATEFLPKVGEFAVQLVGMMAQVLVENLPVLIDAVLQLTETFLSTLADMAPSLIMTIAEAVVDMAETIIDHIDLIIDAGIRLIEGLASGLLEALPFLVAKIPVIIQSLFDQLMANLPKILEAGVRITLELANGLIQAIPDLLAQLPMIIGSIVNGLVTEGIPALWEAGGQLLKGLFEGMFNPSVIWENTKKIGNAILDGFKSLFGIHSPSKLFEDEIGSYLGQGMAIGLGEGFEDRMKAVGATVTRSAASMAGISRTGRGMAYNGASDASASQPIVINQYNTFANSTGSGYEQFKTKQNASAAVRLALAGGGAAR